MRLFRHRRDLRLADDRGFAAAARDDGGDRVVPAFVLDDAVLEHAAPPRVRYLLDALAVLRDHFRERLADSDTADDNGGWQWAASTGTDARPYFRVFDPVTQGGICDPGTEYVREYVPELADVPADRVHAGTGMTDEERRAISREYPYPVVDHAEARGAAIATVRTRARRRRRGGVGSGRGE